MKTQNTNILNTISQNNLQLLTAEVKETLAINIDVNATKTNLKAIDFWNMQRMQRSRGCSKFPSISVR
ncbi:MAG: hypothetical protein H7101_10930 [Deinococcales bacterium]|nr:hypothetical protein [Chitinophagaceae bacterium]